MTNQIQISQDLITCRTCPHWQGSQTALKANCTNELRLAAFGPTRTFCTHKCGQHPDFLKEKKYAA